MPRRAVQLNGKPLVLDARPDRLDLRDLPYRPPVENLPPIYPTDDEVQQLLPGYLQAGLILNQKSEGACTGFGLAAVINFLRWLDAAERGGPMSAKDLVSTRMLYHLARFYDEWPGEDYEGSSCRGALKGWHRHGVCLETLWPYAGSSGGFVRPSEGWDADAVTRPLGVYYRVQRDSVVDMQSAIWQIGAIYVSAEVHDGWSVTSRYKGSPTPQKLPVIKPWKQILGGHAFALVGFNDIGFIVQNSWGTDWGWCGFAILPYDDWVMNGSDAWVMALGTPITRTVPGTTRSARLTSPQYFVRSAGRIGSAGELPSWLGETSDPLRDRKDVWNEEAAYWHSLVTGNDGCIINRLPQVENERDNIKFVGLEQPRKWFEEKAAADPWRLAVYAHGGLNAEGDSIERIRILGPNFEANGIYPVFVTWKSGWQETLEQMLEDIMSKWFGGVRPPAKGLGDAIAEATDRALEAFARNILARDLWSEMKENVTRSSDPGRGIDALAEQLKTLHDASGGRLQIHLIGHSAGAFVCGRLLAELKQRGLGVATCTLFAPACDVQFASLHFSGAVTAGALNRGNLRIHALSDALEKADSVGPYGKSLLYLVSRALERWHKTPLLGLATVFDGNFATDEFWHNDSLPHLRKWQEFFWSGQPVPTGFAKDGKGGNFATLNVLRTKQVDTGAGRVKATHGSFDNSVGHIAGVIETIRGGALLKSVTPLNY